LTDKVVVVFVRLHEYRAYGATLWLLK
jgi:hypothetical protein